MALPITVSYTVLDGKGETSTIPFYIPSSTALGDVAQFATALKQLLYELLGGEITAINFTIPVAVGVSSSNILDPDSDVQERALFTFSSADNFLRQISLPTVVETVFSAGSKLVDLANVDVAAFVTAVLSGVGTPNVTSVTSHDEDIVALDAAREAWGKYRP